VYVTVVSGTMSTSSTGAPRASIASTSARATTSRFHMMARRCTSADSWHRRHRLRRRDQSCAAQDSMARMCDRSPLRDEAGSTCSCRVTTVLSSPTPFGQDSSPRGHTPSKGREMPTRCASRQTRHSHYRRRALSRVSNGSGGLVGIYHSPI
jgi:hypothetical protein